MTTAYIAEVDSINAYRVAHEEQTAAYDADDLLAELCEIGGPLLSAVRHKDAALIGRLVLAVVAAQIERRACIGCEQESAGVYAEMAAVEVMRVHALEIRNTLAMRDSLSMAMRNCLAMADGRHKARRFTGAPVTNWGSAS